MSKNNRLYFFSLTLLISIGLFFVAGSAHAQFNLSVDCGTPSAGMRYAVFVRAIQDSGPPAFDPVLLASYCVLINQSDTEVTYEQLLSAGALPEAQPSLLFTRKQSVCPSSAARRLIFDDWWDDSIGFSERPLTEMRFPLQGAGAPVQCGEGVYIERFRFNIHDVVPFGDNPFFLYFVGFSGEELRRGDPVCSERPSTDCPQAKCFVFENQCVSRADPRLCYRLPQNLCGVKADGATPGSTACVWKAETGKCLNKMQAGATAGIDYSQPGAFPPCGHDGTCDSLNDLLAYQLGFANYAFGFVGVVGFLSFVVGGVQMIASFGNPEKFKKGMQLMVAAVIGLVIVFSAYLIVKFVLDALGVAPEFRGV